MLCVVDEDLKCQCSDFCAYLPSERGYGRAGHEPADPLAAALFGMRRSPPAGVVAPEGIGALLEESILTFKVAKSARARVHGFILQIQSRPAVMHNRHPIITAHSFLVICSGKIRGCWLWIVLESRSISHQR